ncbi:MAG: nuclear transport factor 2 family protein [bacterium]|nr:nuclear transport factor 2 family protein [bacterium]
MTRLDLQALEAIKLLKYKYMRYLDQKRWDELEQLLTEDARCSYSGGKYSYEGRRAIVEFLSSSMDRDSFISCHRVTQPEIELTSETTATGIWALEDTVIDTENEFTLHGAAFYEDEYLRIDGEWKIRSTGYERTFEEIQTRKGVDGPKLTQNAWASE